MKPFEPYINQKQFMNFIYEQGEMEGNWRVGPLIDLLNKKSSSFSYASFMKICAKLNITFSANECEKDANSFDIIIYADGRDWYKGTFRKQNKAFTDHLAAFLCELTVLQLQKNEYIDLTKSGKI